MRASQAVAWLRSERCVVYHITDDSVGYSSRQGGKQGHPQHHDITALGHGLPRLCVFSSRVTNGNGRSC